MKELTEWDKALIIDSTPNANLVLFCPALHGLGATLLDRSQAANHGTISGATWKASPRGLRYLDFNGTNNKVTVAHSASLNLGSIWNIEAWVKADSVAHHVGIVTKYQSTSPYTNIDFVFIILDSGLPHLLHCVSNVAKSVTGTTNLFDSVWHHVRGVNDGTDLKLYVDDVLDGTGVGKGGATDNDSADLLLGLWRTPYGEWFDGGIALPRIENGTVGISHYTRERHLFGV